MLAPEVQEAPSGEKWAFQADGRRWVDYEPEQQAALNAAWRAGETSYAFILPYGGGSYRLDLQRFVQINTATGTSRKIRRPEGALAILDVSSRERRLQARIEALLVGSADEEPAAQLWILASGRALAAAAEAAAAVEVAGLGRCVGIRTGLTREGGASQLLMKMLSAESAKRVSQRKWQTLMSTIDSGLEQAPRVNLLRLMKELRAVQRELRTESPRAGLVSCDLVDDSLMEWEVKMAFPEDSALQRSLRELAESAFEQTEFCLVLRVRFPLDFPGSPPEVLVHKPRLLPGPGCVSFGGRFCSPLLSSAGWQPASQMLGVFEQVRSGLLESGATVDCTLHVRRMYPVPPLLDRLKTELLPTVNGFSKKSVKVLSAAEAGNFFGDLSRLEASDRIGLPWHFGEELYNVAEKDMVLPWMFELKTAFGRKRHCGIYENPMDGIPAEHVILPKWVMEDLCIDERDEIQLRCVKLDLISHVKLQPHSTDFVSAVSENAKGLLQQSLSKFSALTEDTSVPIAVGPNTYHVQVVALRPAAAVRIVENQCADFRFTVDFVAAPDEEGSLDDLKQARRHRIISEQKELRLKQEEQQERRRKLRFKACQKRAKAAVAAAQESPGPADVEIRLRLPGSASPLEVKCEQGAVGAVLILAALDSEWAQKCQPWDVQLRTAGFPELRADSKITKELHRSVVMVREVQAPDDVDDADLEADILAEEEAVPPPPMPLPRLDREISRITRRTLEAAEVQRFVEEGGVEPAEAVRRVQAGHVQPPWRPVRERLPEPDAEPPALARTKSAEEDRAEKLRRFTDATGASEAEALQSLEVSDWNLDTAVGAYFDGLFG